MRLMRPTAAPQASARTASIRVGLPFPARIVHAWRETELTQRIPYTAQVAPGVLRTSFGDYVQMFRLSGASFQSADDVELNVWHEHLNILWRNVASPQVALWTHLVRRRERIGFEAEDERGFAASLARKYRSRLSAETLMMNELYVSLVYRPLAPAASRLARFLSRARPDASALGLSDALEACDKLARTALASLERYEPEPLTVYRRGSRYCSRALELLTLLIDGE
ncbi:MAG TPA: hypothetical protein VGI35_02655, partial [Steroidobacteraceae bacterium]